MELRLSPVSLVPGLLCGLRLKVARWAVAVCLSAGLVTPVPAQDEVPARVIPVDGVPAGGTSSGAERLFQGLFDGPAHWVRPGTAELVLEEEGLWLEPLFEPADPDEIFLPVQAERLTRPRAQDSAIPPDAPAAMSPAATSPGAGNRLGGSNSAVGQNGGSPAPATTSIAGQQQGGLASDTGSLIERSWNDNGVTTQRRNPIVRDPRIRGTRPGQLLASGSNWQTARPDLDTPVSKLDADIIGRVNVIAGPYAARYGPGFTFLDIGFAPTPRYAGGTEFHGSSTVVGQTNGPQGAARQRVWGGGEDWGVSLGYSYRQGDNYRAGNGDRIPSGYQSGVFDLALGIDTSEDSHLEVNYFRLDQRDVRFPGQVFDIDRLVTDAVEVRYILDEGDWFDRAETEAWFNDTAFFNVSSPGAGRPADDKRDQIPELAARNYVGLTDVSMLNTGYRGMLMWGEQGTVNVTAGTDLRYVVQRLDEFSTFDDPQTRRRVTRNSPIPKSYAVDPGLFIEMDLPLTEEFRQRFGARAGLASTDILELPLLTPTVRYTERLLMAELGTSRIERTFPLYSVYSTTEYDLTEEWTLQCGVGYGERPPTLVELYALSPFLGLLQQGLTAVRGGANLAKEKNLQVDVGATWQADHSLVRGRLFHAWVHDFITFTPLGRQGLISPDAVSVAYANTPLATLAGGEAYAEYDLSTWATAFGVATYTEGVNQDRDDQAFLPGQELIEKEPLPGIAPLEGRVGVRLHTTEPVPVWTLEPSLRLVAPQRRIAGTFLERETSSFAIVDLQGTWQPSRSLLVFTGIENLADTFYREHLDLRTGRGTFQPGINVYGGVTVMY